MADTGVFTRLSNKLLELLKASNEVSGMRRDRKMQDLIGYLSAEVEPNVREVLQPYDGRFYYEAMSGFYAAAEGRAACTSVFTFLNRSAVWSHAMSSAVFAMLFHELLLAGEPPFAAVRDAFLSVRTYTVLLRGFNRLFWMDLESGTRRFAPLFSRLLERMLLAHALWLRAPELQPVLSDFFDLAVSFFWHYAPSASPARCPDLPAFVAAVRAQVDAFNATLTPGAAPGPCGSADDAALPIPSLCAAPDDLPALAVGALVRQMELIKSEEALVAYLDLARAQLVATLGACGAMARLKMQLSLQGLGTEGAPMYPTRKIRLHAQDALDGLFPSGRFMRRMVNAGFRFTHPIQLLLALVRMVYAFVALILLRRERADTKQNET